jgi:PEP-CTERM motif
VIDFGDPDNIRSGNVLSGTITNLSATQITTILGNPTNFYYNVHNGAFPNGAVRDQLVPEPTSMILIVGGVVGLLAFSRRRGTF